MPETSNPWADVAWEDVEKHKSYQSATPEHQHQVRGSYFDGVTANHAGFQALTPDKQANVREKWLNPVQEKAPVNILGGMKDVGQMIYDAPVHTAAAIGSWFEDDDIDQNDSLPDQLRRASHARSELRHGQDGGKERILPLTGLTRGHIRDTSASSGHSIASMIAGAPGAAVSLLPVPGARPLSASLTMAGSGAAGYKQDTVAFTDQIFRAQEQAFGRKATDQERKDLLAATADLRRQHGLWEAIPEAVGNVIQFRGLGKLFTKAMGKNVGTQLLKNMATMYGGELLTESITQTGQHNVEIDAGLGTGPKRSFASPTDMWQSLKEVAPQTFILTSLMGGGGHVAGKTYSKFIADPKAAATIKEAVAEDQLNNIPDDSLSSIASAAEELAARRPKDGDLQLAVTSLTNELLRRADKSEPQGGGAGDDDVSNQPKQTTDSLISPEQQLAQEVDQGKVSMEELATFREDSTFLQETGLTSEMIDAEVARQQGLSEDIPMASESVSIDPAMPSSMQAGAQAANSVVSPQAEPTSKPMKIIDEKTGKIIARPNIQLDLKGQEALDFTQAQIEGASEEQARIHATRNRPEPAPDKTQNEATFPHPESNVNDATQSQTTGQNLDQNNGQIALEIGDKAEQVPDLPQEFQQQGYTLFQPEMFKTSSLSEGERFLVYNEKGHPEEVTFNPNEYQDSQEVEVVSNIFPAPEQNPRNPNLGRTNQQAAETVTDLAPIMPKNEDNGDTLEEHAQKTGKSEHDGFLHLSRKTPDERAAIKQKFKNNNSISQDEAMEVVAESNGFELSLDHALEKQIITHKETGATLETGHDSTGKEYFNVGGTWDQLADIGFDAESFTVDDEKVRNFFRAVANPISQTEKQTVTPQSEEGSNERRTGERAVPSGKTVDDISNRDKVTDELLDRVAQGDQQAREELKRKVKDDVLGDYGVVKQEDVKKAMQEFADAKIPFVVDVTDGGNLGGLNAIMSHPEADEHIKDIWGGILATELQKHNAVVGKSGGDEFYIAFPNVTEEQAQKIRTGIETKILDERDKRGFKELPHPKNEGMITGAMHTYSGIIDSSDYIINGKVDSVGLFEDADKLQLANKKIEQDKLAKEQGYIPAEDGKHYVKRRDVQQEARATKGDGDRGPTEARIEKQEQEGERRKQEGVGEPQEPLTKVEDGLKEDGQGSDSLNQGNVADARQRPETESETGATDQRLDGRGGNGSLEEQTPESGGTEEGRNTSEESQGPAQVVAESEVSQGKPASGDSQPGAKTTTIEDFGEKIGGARKDYAEKLKQASELDINAVPFSKSWPEPNYKKLLESGKDKFAVAFARASRDTIPTKPRAKWKLSAYAEKVEKMRFLAENILNGTINEHHVKMSAFDVYDIAKLYEELGHDKSLKGLMIREHQFSMKAGVRYDPPKRIWSVERKAKATAFSNMPKELGTGATRDEAIADFKKNFAKMKEGPKTKRKVKFDTYTKRGQKGVWIGKQVGRNWIDLKKFASARDAIAYEKTHYDSLVKSLEQKKYIPDVRRKSNEERIGDDHRQGKDVTPEMFTKAFGFRGVEFGNWVGKKKERQMSLNNSYDALFDMASILDIPTQAVSLNGELGLAFGARGKGGKGAGAAHYESGRVVINLTKRAGAGSLAHEWFHAMDNYFSRMRNDGDRFISERPYEIMDKSVREEILKAFKHIQEVIGETEVKQRSKKLDSRRSTPYWSTNVEINARLFENFIIEKMRQKGETNDYLANVAEEGAFVSDMFDHMAEDDFKADDFYPYLTESELQPVAEAFDGLFSEIKTKKTDKGTALYSKRKGNGPGQTVKAVKKKVNRVAGGLGEKVRVVADVWALPPHLQTYAGNEDQGVFDPKTQQVYLIASNISKGDNIETIVIHEVVGHYGFEKLMAQGKLGWSNMVSSIAKLKKKGNRSILQAARKVKETHGNLDAKTEAREIIAWLAQNKPKHSVIQRIIHTIRRAFRGMGINLNVRESEIFDMIRQAEGAVKQSQADGQHTPVLTAGAMAQKKTPTWYSPAARGAATLKQTKGSPDQMLNMLKKQPGVKSDELEWTGVEEWLEGKKSVTRDELAEFIDGNGVQVEEVVKGAYSKDAQQLYRELRDKNNGRQFDDWSEGDQDAWMAHREKPKSVKFDDYQIPGGENYKELLLTLPYGGQEFEQYQESLQNKYGIKNINDILNDKVTKEELDKYWRLGSETSEDYTSGHYDEPNILAHVRFNERIDANGNKVLFLEEVQSDWHQAGRKKGYKSRIKVGNGVDQELRAFVLADLRGEGDEATLDILMDRYGIEDNDGDIGALLKVELDQQVHGVPNAPYKKSWPALAMKRMIRYGAENGFDSVAWTTGEQQADRYSLSHQVEDLRIFHHGDGLWDISATKKGGGLVDIATRISEKQLASNIGKEMAKRAIESQSGRGWKTYSGLDLKVGGEGMQGFYDKILPAVANKLGKKFGARVGTVSIRAGHEVASNIRDKEARGYFNKGYQVSYINIDGDYDQITDIKDFENFAPEAYFMVEDLDKRGEQVMSLPITAKLRDSAMEGMPLFAKRKHLEQELDETIESVLPKVIKHTKDKKDLNLLEKIFSSGEYFFRKVGATKRMFAAQMNRRDEKVHNENHILGDFVEDNQKFKKKHPKLYAIANKYLLEVDKTGEAFNMQNLTGWQVQTADGTVIGRGFTRTEVEKLRKTHMEENNNTIKDYEVSKADWWIVKNHKNETISNHETEDEAKLGMYEAETADMKEKGLVDKVINSVMGFRRMTNRAFDMMVADMRRIIEEAREQGLDEPTVETLDESKRWVVKTGKGKKMFFAATKEEAQEKANAVSSSKTVHRQDDSDIRKEVTLTEAISLMGDLRGAYFPRIRKPGAFILTATHDNGRQIREHFDIHTVKRAFIDPDTGMVTENFLTKVIHGGQTWLNAVSPAAMRKRKLEKQGFTVSIDQDTSTPESVFDAAQLMASVDALLNQSLENIKKDSQEFTKASREINKLVISNVADLFKTRGYLSSRMKRAENYWEGFEEDLLMAGTQYAKSMSGGFAKRNAARQMTLAITGRDIPFKEWQGENENKDYDEYLKFVMDRRLDPGKQKGLYAETMGWMREVLRNDERSDRLMSTLKGLTALKFLGFRVSSALVNGTNMFQAVPATLSGHAGISITEAFKHIGHSAGAYSKYRLRKKSDKPTADDLIFLDINNRGWDEAQFNQEAAAVVQSKMGNTWDNFMAKAMFMFGAVEKVNRATTIFAAYKALKKSMPKGTPYETLMEKAKHVSDRAHGVYSKETAPAWTRGAVNPLKLAWMFQKFSQNYILNMVELGMNKNEWKAVSYMMLSPAILAGAGASLMTPVISGLAGALGLGGDDPEEEFYAWATAAFGSDRFMRHGLAGLAGVNLKGSLQANNPMPKNIKEIFGAPQAIFTDTQKAFSHFFKGELFKSLEAAAPTGIGNISRAYRENKEGVTTGSYAPVFYGTEPLKTSAFDSALRFLSFNPAEISGIREKQWKERLVAKKYTQRRGEISDKAKRYKVQGTLAENWPKLLKEIYRYNELVRASGRRDITLLSPKKLFSTIRRSQKANKKERRRNAA